MEEGQNDDITIEEIVEEEIVRNVEMAKKFKEDGNQWAVIVERSW